MKWVYDLCGAEPIIKDIPVYDAAAIAQGEMLMLAASANFTVGTGFPNAAVSAYSSTVVTAHAAKVVGVSLEAKDTDDSPSVATATDTTAEVCYVKTIVNPNAVYRAEILSANNGTCGDIAVSAWTAAGDCNVAVTPTAAETMLTSEWMYVSNAEGPNFGQLRLVLDTATADSFQLDSAPTNTSTTADRVIFIPHKLQYGMGLSNVGTGLSNGSAVLKIAACTALRVVETLMDADGGLEIMHNHTHKTSLRKKAGKAAKFYNDITCLDHCFK